MDTNLFSGGFMIQLLLPLDDGITVTIEVPNQVDLQNKVAEFGQGLTIKEFATKDAVKIAEFNGNEIYLNDECNYHGCPKGTGSCYCK